MIVSSARLHVVELLCQLCSCLPNPGHCSITTVSVCFPRYTSPFNSAQFLPLVYALESSDAFGLMIGFFLLNPGYSNPSASRDQWLKTYTLRKQSQF